MASAESTDKTVPSANWGETLRAAATDVFSMMVGAEVTVPAVTDPPLRVEVTGMVGIAGAFSAVCSVRCSAKSATRIASQMLGISAEDAAPQARDAIGEVCNIVAGDFKEKIGLGDKCMLSVPTVVSGSDYQLHAMVAGERVDVPLLYEGEPVWIALDIRK